MSRLGQARGGAPVRKDDTKKIESDTRDMEAKLELLRRTLDSTDQSAKAKATSSRWQSGAKDKPMTRGYAQSVLETRQSKNSGTQKPASGTSGASTPSKPDTTIRPQGTVTELAGACTANLLPSVPQDSKSLAKAAAGANLQNALSRQSSEEVEVRSFLADLKLDRYCGLFLEHGFDCMEVVYEMQESHMQDVGMAAGHIIKLKKKIAELGHGDASSQGGCPSAAVSSSMASKSGRVSFGGTETQAFVSSPEQAQAGGNDVTAGAFNEEESAASFQEALKAWRSGGSAAPSAGANATGGVAGGHAASSPSLAVSSAPGSFWTKLGGDEVDLSRLSPSGANLQSGESGSLLLLGNAGSESQTATEVAQSEEKVCCYQCYKQLFAKHAIERTARDTETVRSLCSERCAEVFEAASELRYESQQKRRADLEKLAEMRRALDAEKATADLDPGDAEAQTQAATSETS